MNIIAVIALTTGLSGSAVVAVPRSRADLQSLAPQAAAAIAQAITARRGEAQAIDDDLRALYAGAPEVLVWFDSSGRPLEAARAALRLLAGAAGDGLRPADYLSPPLLTLLETDRLPASADRASFDVTLSVAMLRYMRELRFGRVDSRTLREPARRPAGEGNLATTLRSALNRGEIPSLPAQLAPPLIQYRLLRQQLDAYRRLAGHPALQGPLPTPSPSVLRPREAYAGAGMLYQRLLTLGDLPPDTPNPQATYTDDLAAGVRRFQRRHGLLDDGVIGQTTWAALQVPFSWRIRQIELALERLRGLPPFGEERVIAIAIPMFRLWGWDPASGDELPALSMKVIVGRGQATETPALLDEIEYVVFGPYWNVPSSIVRHEILPALARDPDYLSKHQMEIVRGGGDDAEPVPATPANLGLVRAGTLRIRQRPGPHNALGLIKFAFPNDHSIYLHGTPAPSLFQQSRRDFSHGCIRVEDPVALAEWALSDQSRWDRERIVAAAATSVSRRVDLAQPIRIVLFYTTAAVLPEDGALHFADDVYHRDLSLHRALEARPAARNSLR